MHYKLFSITVFLIILSCNAFGEECYQSADASTPSKRFNDLKNGAVLDTKTGLTWARCPYGMTWSKTSCLNKPSRVEWRDASFTIKDINQEGGYAGYRDWRLPTLKELSTLVESQCYEPAINREIFPNTPTTGFWTSTKDTHNTRGAWLVYFLNGSQYVGNWGYEWAIRMVRN